MILMALSLVVACGAPPPPAPPPAPVEPPKPKMINGILETAYNRFKEGAEHLKNHRYVEASDAFKEVVAQQSDYTIAWLNLAFSYECLGRYKDAANTYRKLIELKVNDPKVKLAYGRSLLLSGDAKVAIGEFEAVLRADPESLEARNNLAAAYLKVGDDATCLKYVKEVLAKQPKNVPAIVNLGLLYHKEKKYEIAILMFNKAIKYDEKFAKAYSNLGLTYYTIDQKPQAVVNFEKAVELEPTLDEARLNLGSVYLDYLDYARSLEQFQKVLARFPERYEAMVGAADALYGTGQFKDAVEMYLKTIKIKEKNPEVYLRLAKLYEEKMESEDKESKKKAVGFYESYIRLFAPPKEHKVHELLANLKAVIQMEEAEKNNPKPKEQPADGQTPAPADGQTPAPADGQTPAPAPAPTDAPAPAPADANKPAEGQTPAPANK